MDDGSCARDRLYMQVMTRSLDPIPEEKLPLLRMKVRDACVEPGDFQATHRYSETCHFV